jgi:hypothetical protein
MAKLPEIRYERAAKVSGGLGPGSAVAEYKSRQSIVDTVFSVAEGLANEHAEYELNQTTSMYGDASARFEQDAAGLDSLDQKQITDMGLDDVFTAEDGKPVPKFQWYPVALERVMERSRTELADNITLGKNRESWDREMQTAEQAQLTRIVKQSEEAGRQYYRDIKIADFDNALTGLNFGTARSILDDPLFANDPALQAKLRDSINVAEEDNRLNVMGRNDSPAELRAEAVRMGTPEYNKGSPYDTNEANARIATLNRMADAKDKDAESGQKKLEIQQKAVLFADLNKKILNKTLTADDLAGIEMRPGMTSSDVNKAYGMLDNFQENDSPYAKVSTPAVLKTVRQAVNDVENVTYADARAAVDGAAGDLTAGKYDELDRAVEARLDPVKQSGSRTTSQKIDGMITSMRIDTSSKASDTDVQVAESFRSAVFNAIAAESRAKGGRELSGDEVTKIVNDTFMTQQRVEEDGGWFFFDKEHPNIFEKVSTIEGKNYPMVKMELDRIIAREPRARYTTQDYADAYTIYKQENK